MVLDEDALEAMLKRQQRSEPKDRKQEADPSKPSKQVELTDKTEEFEVYERPDADSATGTGIRSTRGQHTDASPVFPEAFQHEPVADPEDDEPEAEEPGPEPIPEPAPMVAQETEVVSEAEPPRPRVWPPLSKSKPAPVAEPVPPVAEPETIQEEEREDSMDLPDPVWEAEPEPEPEEPVAAVEPAKAASADPHSHAHATIRPDGGGVRIAIVQALFNQEITDMMADLAVAKAKKRGAKVTHHLTVPGVYDLPLVTARLLEQDDVDCAVVIGVVVQGETSHDELITHATARTLQQLSLDLDKPIGFGITGPGMTWKQAEARVANGAHAVDAALAQVEALKAL